MNEVCMRSVAFSLLYGLFLNLFSPQTQFPAEILPCNDSNWWAEYYGKLKEVSPVTTEVVMLRFDRLFFSLRLIVISSMIERVGVQVEWIGIAYPYSLYLYIHASR